MTEGVRRVEYHPRKLPPAADGRTLCSEGRSRSQMGPQGTNHSAAIPPLSSTRASTVKSSREDTCSRSLVPWQTHDKARAERRTHTTLPLIEAMKHIVRIVAFRGDRCRLTKLEEVGSFPGEPYIRCYWLKPGERNGRLTRPRLRVITSTKWEENITRKYRVASFAMQLKMDGILSPCASNVIAKKMITENARKSYLHMSSEMSVSFRQ